MKIPSRHLNTKRPIGDDPSLKKVDVGQAKQADAEVQAKQAGNAGEVQKTAKTAVVDDKAAVFDAKKTEHNVTGDDLPNRPSEALSQQARIMSPHLLFQEVPSTSTKGPGNSADDGAALLEKLLDQPFVPTSRTSDAADAGPLLATLPPGRKLPVGNVSFHHDDGVLNIVGKEAAVEGKKPGNDEVVSKKMTLGRAAQFATAFDAALQKQYPRFSSNEPQELWIGMAGAEKAAGMALKIDDNKGFAYDVAKTLRSFMPKAKPIMATKTVMEQIQAFAGLADAVMKDGKPEQNLVDLQQQGKGESLLDEMLKEHDRKTGARSLLDDVLDQPVAKPKPKALPDDDKAVVGQEHGRDVTAGEVRERAFRSQKAVAFVVEGFADAHGSERTLKMQVEKKGKGFEWSFHGVAGGRDRIISGDFSPEGVKKFQDAVEKQPRYDHIPYKTKVPKFSVALTDAALGGLEKDRAQLEAQMKQRGGTPVSEVFPDLA